MPDYRSASVFRKLGIATELVAIVVPIDFLLFSGEVIATVISPAITIPVGIGVGLFSCYWQRKRYGDTRFRAVAKGALLGVLTAIPTPLASIFTFMGGVLPLFDKKDSGKTGMKEGGMKKTQGRVIEPDENE